MVHFFVFVFDCSHGRNVIDMRSLREERGDMEGKRKKPKKKKRKRNQATYEVRVLFSPDEVKKDISEEDDWKKECIYTGSISISKNLEK
jgi:hypothetical protein